MFIVVMLYIIMMITSYLLGSVNNAIIICKFLNLDIRQLGSGNPGAMNMIRSVGLGWGLLTLFMDAIKGVVPAILGWYLLGTPFSFAGSRIGICVCGLCVISGHIFPIYYKFKGGKGVASTLGICFVLNPLVSGISFLLLMAIIMITKIGFIASFVGVGIPLIFESVREFICGDYLGGAILLIIFGSVVFMHRSNIKRFIHGKENKISLFGKKREKVAQKASSSEENEPSTTEKQD